MEFANSIFVWRCGKDASTKQIADTANATWRDINTALSPVIGQNGVLALFKRSFHLQKIHYPVLNVMPCSKTLPGECFAELHSILIQQTNANALLINSALLNTFYGLLTNLIGISLARKLLHSIFATPSSGDPAQDILS